MENQKNGNNGGKAIGILQKLLRYRLKIDRKGTPIVNISSIFALACLIFAPHMSIAGIVISLLLGYHINLETEGDNAELEERLRKAAANMKTTAANVTRTIQTEINRTRAENQKNIRTAPAPEPIQETAQIPAQEIPSNQDILQDLEKHADAFTQPANPNPAATTFHSAYSASAGSVPTLHVEETAGGEPAAPAKNQQSF